MIIGASAPKAIRPKPSSIGLRPRMLVARPTPSAVSSGAVTVEATTPPESKARPTSCGGEKAVNTITTR
ncbi:MAG: hypothetical protein AW08_03419 [Candidatus Accumulibacter adjunctus]|uniref:Uncharacterized protein n=1 Tax=Candidatus Accumulibacter adjunctus TaxID=1454001 RepID=A0A011NKL8_9PROT|nr:MAG: hypothetical protein AW08_03419 [Candidatus Accumulibacter adjunctus]